MVFNNDIILHGNNFIKTLKDISVEHNICILSPCVLQPEKDQCY